MLGKYDLKWFLRLEEFELLHTSVNKGWNAAKMEHLQTSEVLQLKQRDVAIQEVTQQGWRRVRNVSIISLEALIRTAQA